jgi:hypothetical protein
MTGKPFAPRDAESLAYYTLPADAYKNLCVVRDELRLFAAVAARRAAHRPEVLMCRSTLAYCFDHLAQRMDDIVSVLNEASGDQACVPPAQSSALKH